MSRLGRIAAALIVHFFTFASKSSLSWGYRPLAFLLLAVVLSVASFRLASIASAVDRLHRQGVISHDDYSPAIVRWFSKECSLPVDRLWWKVWSCKIENSASLRDAAVIAPWTTIRYITVDTYKTSPSTFAREWMPVIAPFRGTEELLLIGSMINDVVLSRIASTAATDLCLVNTSVTSDTLRALKMTFPRLNRLGWQGGPFTTDLIKALSVNAVYRLSFQSGTIGVAEAQVLSKVETIEQLFLDDCDVSSEAMAIILGAFPRLDVLFVDSFDDSSFPLDVRSRPIKDFDSRNPHISFRGFMMLCELVDNSISLGLSAAAEPSWYSRQSARFNVRDDMLFEVPSGFPGNHVITAPGGSKAVQDLRLGDKITCRSAYGFCDDESRATACQDGVVRKMGETRALSWLCDKDKLLNVYLKVSFGDIPLTTTAIQPLYVEGRGWVEAHEVKVGDKLRGKDGPTPEITAIERVPPEPTFVIRTEGNLPYFVSPPGADFTVWVP